MKTNKQLLGMKTKWAIITEAGKIIEKFRLKATANNKLIELNKLRFDDEEKLLIKEIEIK